MLVVTVVLAGLVAAPAGAAPSFPPDRPTRVLILGDSVLKGTANLYGKRLAGRDVTVDAVVSRTTAASADRLAELGSDWDVVVVLLGYNDGGSARAFQPGATRILDQLAGVPRVIWLSLHEVRTGYAAVNRFIADQAARRPNLRTADWNAVCNANPGSLGKDGIHPKGAGPGVLADLVAAQVTKAETDRVAEAQAAAQAADAERVRAENEAQAQALRDIADAQQRAIWESAVRAQQQADAALASQHDQIVASQLNLAALEARIAQRRADEAVAAAARTRRYLRIARSVATTTDLGERSTGGHVSSVALVGLAILGVAGTGAGTTAIVTRRRRRPRRAA